MTAPTLVIDRTLTQADFDLFARLSGDDNPIHVDPGFSARTRFGRTVAHGLLLCTILRGLAGRLLPGAVLLGQDIRFPAPTYAGEPMRFSATLTGQQIAVSVTRRADGVVTCDGTFEMAGTWTC
ncbi:hydratase [Niveispirillum sp. SYP-B3756]|uniref:MaoC/PaaZ C-terminal domain-containing protein n=1 Tax=Niveispirillum sp. SYP-B3756 TaxID=2662178 RepID=UPI001292890B|nr:MaoC/PaaZ C-terminal domain-containing protein [Niveispirillum sp. SYP-B3756]MQP64576.1 hydratase [Niveispirillum sp. SYP-B3756]